jgi:hypothetical protein
MFEKGYMNDWIRYLMIDLLNFSKPFSERVNLELYIIARLMDHDAERRYLVDGNWIRKYVKYLTEDEESCPPIYNYTLKNGIITNETIIFTVNQFLWNYWKLIHGGGPDVSYLVNTTEERLKLHPDPELWHLVDESPSLSA